MDSPLYNNNYNSINNIVSNNNAIKNNTAFTFNEPEKEKPSSSIYSNNSLNNNINNEPLNENEISLLISKRYIDLLRFAMATCHNLKVINGKLIGDPLDIEMFKFIDWSIQENDSSIDGLSTIVRPKNNISFETEKRLNEIDSINSISNSQEIEENSKIASSKHLFELGILRVFEFASHLRRMSVIVRRMYSQESNLIVSDSLEVFVKGAPEVIRDICKNKTSKLLKQNEYIM